MDKQTDKQTDKKKDNKRESKTDKRTKDGQKTDMTTDYACGLYILGSHNGFWDGQQRDKKGQLTDN